MTTPKPPTELTPAPNSRLSQLCAEYATVEPEAYRMNNRLEELRSAIKAELSQALPDGDHAIILNNEYLAQPLRLRSEQAWRLDTKAFKAAHPHLYVEFAVKGTSWKLEKVRDR